ncbi:MAG: hypothetical protein IJJ33_08545, partial [Victivallales bacterium]|nr:hypothetical protein [Victivallales bacterium]
MVTTPGLGDEAIAPRREGGRDESSAIIFKEPISDNSSRWGGLTTEHWNIIVTASDLESPTVPQRNAARMPEETPMRRPPPSRLAAVSVLALLLCALASPGEQKAVITELSISGPTEHTLVIPPSFPEYTQTFSCRLAWRVSGESDPEKEEAAAEFEVKYLWAAGGCEISGPNTGSSVTVLYRAWHASSASVTCSVTIEPTNEFGTGTG